MTSIQHWRGGLVDKSIQLLPEVEQQKLKSGQMTELPSDNNTPRNPTLIQEQNPILPSLLFQINPSQKSSFEPNLDGITTNYGTTPQVSSQVNTERGMNMLKSISKNFKFDDINTTPLKEAKRGSSRVRKNEYLQNDQFDLPISCQFIQV